MNPRSLILALLAYALLTTIRISAQEQRAIAAPVYPRVNPTTWYEVDAVWPERPQDVPWAAVPGVAVDREDNVWLYTRTTPAVQVYSPEGKYLFGWGSGSGAHHLKIDQQGYIWTADVEFHTVQKHARDGTVLMTLGTNGEAGEDETHFFKPTDMAIASDGGIFISDGYGNARIVRFDKDGKFIKAWGTLGTEDGKFSIPHAIAIDSMDRIYVADRNNARIQVYNPNGDLIDSWKNIVVPWGFWIADNDEIWVCGSSPMPWHTDPRFKALPLGCPPKDQLVMKFNPKGKLLQLWTFPKGEDGQEKPGELNWVHCIALDSKGDVFLGDITGKRLQKFVPKR